jgi:hypothetical protein
LDDWLRVRDRVAVARGELVTLATAILLFGAALLAAGTAVEDRWLRWPHLLLWVAFLTLLISDTATSIG